jgi:hypothetical protein
MREMCIELSNFLNVHRTVFTFTLDHLLSSLAELPTEQLYLDP